MQEFYKAISDLLAYVAGEEIALKGLVQLSTEIGALVGTGDNSWLAYFASPVNLISLFVHGGAVYALLFTLMYFPWVLYRSLIGMPKKRRGDK